MDSIDFIKPFGAFYFFVDIRKIISEYTSISNSKDYCIKLLEEVKVATVPGSVFGTEGYIRISYAKSIAEITEALERMKIFIQKLK